MIAASLSLLLLANSAFAGYLVLPLRSREVALLDLSNNAALCNREIGQIPTLNEPLFAFQKPNEPNKIVYCGGEVENAKLAHEHSAKCHLLNMDKEKDQWEPFGWMLYGRRRGVAVPLKDGRIFVAGGSSNLGWDDHTLDTTEILTLEGDRLKNTIEGPRLPRKYSRLCVAQLNENEAIITGGRKKKQYAVKLDLNTAEFSDEVELSTDHYYAFCGILKGEFVLFGGRETKNNAKTDKVSFVNVDNGKVTRKGPAMPIQSDFASFSSTDNEHIYMNTGSGLFVFDGEKWEKLDTDKSIRSNAAHHAVYLENVDC